MLLRQAERGLIDEAQRITGLPVRTLQNLSIQGQIPGAAKLGKRWTYDIVRLREWVSACEQATTRAAAKSASEVNFTGTLFEPSINERYRKALAWRLAGGTRPL